MTEAIISPSIYIPLGAIAAATIAGAISFISSVLSKDQKTSEFRQTWIDGVRDDLSEFISRIEVVTAFLAVKHLQNPGSDKLELLLSKSDDIQEASARYYRLQLRLNPKEHKNLLDKLSVTYDALSKLELICDRKQIGSLTQQIIIEAQDGLKTEWKRVKRGEPAFYITKSVSLGAVIFALGSLLYLIYV